MKIKFLFLDHRARGKSGQTAVEYLILLGVVMAIVLIGMKTYLPRTGAASNLYFDRVTNTLLGAPNPCGDGTCQPWEVQPGNLTTYCCVDCNAYCP